MKKNQSHHKTHSKLIKKKYSQKSIKIMSQLCYNHREKNIYCQDQRRVVHIHEKYVKSLSTRKSLSLSHTSNFSYANISNCTQVTLLYLLTSHNATWGMLYGVE